MSMRSRLFSRAILNIPCLSITVCCLLNIVGSSKCKASAFMILAPSQSILALAATRSFLFLQASKTVVSQVPFEGHIHQKMPSSSCNGNNVPTNDLFDEEYPGTAVQRLQSVHQRVKQLVSEDRLINRPWEDIRKELLWAGGLRDLQNVLPGKVRLCKAQQIFLVIV
jgi:hypothetical protein